jgi:Zn-dependent protease
MESTAVFSIIVLILSVVIHEVSHGYAALAMGDVTAKYAGRLTLNPIKHIDPVGSILVPLIFLILPGSLMLGWAKPVPYNPYNLRNQRWGELVVAAAGPLSNIVLAIVFGLLIRFAGVLGLPLIFIDLALIVVIVNLVLAVFNLIPVPPLDGSKILFALLPTNSMLKVRAAFDRYGMILILLILFFAWQFIWPIVVFLTEVITGF